MTVTPSPKSVVPTDAQIDSAIKATEYKYFGDYEMSHEQFAAVDTLVAAAAELTRLREAAPSSLAGGEVVSVPALTIAACKGEQERFEAWAKSKRYEMSEHPLHYIFNDPKTDAARMGWNAALAYVREAALSPEAPALNTIGCAELEVGRAVYERIEKLIDTTTGPEAEELSYLAHLAASVEEVGGYDGPEAPARKGGEWFGVTGAADETEALAVALFDARCPGIRMTDEDLHYYRAAAQRAMKAVVDELDTPALTPRHEAPAEGAWEMDDDDASTYAPSIAGLSDYLWNQAQAADSVEGRCILELWREAVDALRARSSAPEARS